MQLIIAASILGVTAFFLGKLIIRFISLDMKQRAANNSLKKAAVELLQADLKPTKIERATAEAQAKSRMKLALRKHDAMLKELIEAEN